MQNILKSIKTLWSNSRDKGTRLLLASVQKRVFLCHNFCYEIWEIHVITG